MLLHDRQRGKREKDQGNDEEERSLDKDSAEGAWPPVASVHISLAPREEPAVCGQPLYHKPPDRSAYGGAAGGGGGRRA